MNSLSYKGVLRLRRFKYFVLLILFFPLFLYAKKTDIIILDNGDHLTGDIKFMEQAILRLKTDAMSSINIKWKKIRYVKSNQSFRIEKSDGSLLFGMIETDTVTAELIVDIGETAQRVPLKEVVAITEVKDTFEKGVKLTIDVGFTYTKASNVLQFNISGDAGYRTLFWNRTLNFRSVLTTLTDSTFSKNQNINLTFYRLLRKKYFITGFTNATQNTELSLKIRLALGLGFGRYFLRTNTMIFDSAIGAQGTREWKYGSNEPTNNVEGLIAVNFERFILFSPKFNLNINFKAYPNITDWGRIRIDFESKLNWEIMKDFFWGVTFYNNFDSKPIEVKEKKSKNDYGITVSLGWNYN